MRKQYLFLIMCLLIISNLQAQHKKDTLDLEKCFNQNLSEVQRAEQKKAIFN